MYVLVGKQFGPHDRSGCHGKLNIYKYRFSEIQDKYPIAA
jgi:hypothetical protein